MGAGALNDLPDLLRILQHGTGAQVVVIEGLAVVIGHEQRRGQHLQQGLLPDVGVGVVDEHAGVAVAVGVDVQKAPAPAMQPPTYSPSFWKSIIKMGLVWRYSSRILW